MGDLNCDIANLTDKPRKNELLNENLKDRNIVALPGQSKNEFNMQVRF